MLSKISYLLAISILSYLTIPNTVIYPNLTHSASLSPQIQYNVENYKLLTSIPDENIYLYAMDFKEEKIKQSGVFKDALLVINGKEQHFSWTIDTNEAFKPELILKDINHDNIKELMVITTKWTGTGVFVQEAHIFDTDTFKSITIDSPLDFILKNIKTEIRTEKNIVTITINTNTKKFTKKFRESHVGLWLDNVYFSNHITYNIINNRIVAKVGAQVSPSMYVGEAIIEYDFKNNSVVPSNIIFNSY